MGGMQTVIGEPTETFWNITREDIIKKTDLQLTYNCKMVFQAKMVLWVFLQNARETRLDKQRLIFSTQHTY